MKETEKGKDVPKIENIILIMVVQGIHMINTEKKIEIEENIIRIITIEMTSLENIKKIINLDIVQHLNIKIKVHLILHLIQNP